MVHHSNMSEMQNVPPVPQLMGILNATPDSFSDGGDHAAPERAIAAGFAMVEEGAAILDIGGESTRPGADLVDEAEEARRVLPVVEGLAGKTSAVLSIDTRKPGVARQAFEAGARIWNDVSALTFDGKSLDVARDLTQDFDCRIVLMHAQGDPKTMQASPAYVDVVEEVYGFLARRIEACVAAGMDEACLVVDPGIGFGKTLDHNLKLLSGLGRFHGLGAPILLGASRKRFISDLDREMPARERLGGSLAVALQGWRKGAHILRVHDVATTRQALAVAAALGLVRVSS